MRANREVALVTGGGAGIGRATAIAFAEDGCRVLVADVDDEGGRETVRIIQEAEGEAVYVHADVSDPAQVEQMVARAVESFGRLDYAFNNAGIEGVSAPTAECTLENWNRVLAVNLTGVWLCMKEEIAVMLRQGHGTIVNCSSVAGLVGFASSPAYVASKHGLVGLTKTAALEYATRGIRINAVCPGIIDTAMIDRYTHGAADAESQMVAMEPMGRMGTPTEVACAVIWLCSADSSFVTGHALVVDGGFVAR